MAAISVLVTGASGVVGWHLCRYLRRRGVERVLGTYHTNPPDLPGVETLRVRFEEEADQAALRRKVGSFDAVIHTAALTSPDECERDPARASRVNVDSTDLLCGEMAPGRLLVFLSTDLVFDGCAGGYTEEDQPRPVNFYGETKVKAEELVKRRRDSVVIRLARVYSNGSPYHRCFLNWMEDRLMNNQPVPLFTDQFRTPICVEDVCRGVYLALRGEGEGRGEGERLYHLGGPVRLSRYEFGKLFADVYGYPETLLRPTRMGDAGLVARGADCSLDSSRFERDYGWRACEPAEGLRRLLAERMEKSMGQDLRPCPGTTFQGRSE